MAKNTSQQGLSLFDRFASAVSQWVSRGWFFVACVLLVVVWAPSFTMMDIDTWQLVINTVTTIITFLLVALLQNTQRRSDQAIQQKLNAIADALADLMRADVMRSGDGGDARLKADREELLDAVGLEKRVSSS